MAAVQETCRTMLELHIVEDAQPEAMIQTLASGMHKAKTKYQEFNFNST